MEEGENNKVLDVVQSPEFDQYLEELRERLPGYGRRAAGVTPKARGSVEWLGRIGKFWWEARERKSLTRQQVAERSSIPVNKVRFLEVGLATWDEIQDTELLQSLAAALEEPALYEQCKNQFGL